MDLTPNVVVFDLGGVLARICPTWQEAASVAGVSIGSAGTRSIALTSFEGFDEYQAGRISFADYTNQLGAFLGSSADDAARIHNSIIVEEYEGVAELVRDLRAHGCRVGCISNTNDAHWEHLAVNGLYPTIETLEMKMASHLVGINKPDPAIFQLFMSTHGIEPWQVAFFDDLPANVESAKSVGWHAARIEPGNDTAAQMRRHLTDWHVLPA